MRTHPAFVRLLHVLALILLSGLFVLGTGCVHNNDPWYDDPPPPRRQAGPSPAPLIPFAEAPRSFRIFRLRPRTGHGTGMAAAPHTACDRPCAHRRPLPGNALSGQGYFLP